MSASVAVPGPPSVFCMSVAVSVSVSGLRSVSRHSVFHSVRHFNVPFQGTTRRGRRRCISVSAERSRNDDCSPLRLTYLEGNSWLWEVKGTRILVDPVLVGNLDFGVPLLYDGAKKTLKNFQLSELKRIDCLLITQSLDDHCHQRTLKPLSEMFPNMHVVSTPNAESILNSLFEEVVYIEPGQNTKLMVKDGLNIHICASAGPVLGPPWQRSENGYLVKSEQPKFTLYYEPHCVYKSELLKSEQADVVITPVIKQMLPGFTLVSGQEDAVQLARLLNAKFVVPMNNGDLDSKGLLSTILSSKGTVESFKEILSKSLPHVQVLEPVPGKALDVPL
eukprot:TRINITY_DN6300_c0_g1_i1.p1 TRINITY_DN6300_c0_g1~~TRINITY_DN6300_c0_g1_i1.p1  ORF type:complete len:334 (-),score=62.50 TRINITY_DN6300_c0_g1_i1:156-1157(-)